MKVCSKYKRLIRTVLSIILCISIIGGVTIQSIYCAPFVIPLASLAPIVAKILVTAGVSFITYEALRGASNECINGMSESMANELRRMATNINNGVVNVSSNVWNYCKSWVDSKFNVGTNIYTYLYEEEYDPDLVYLKDDIFKFIMNGVENECYLKELSDGSAVPVLNGVEQSYKISADYWRDLVICDVSINTGGSNPGYQLKYTFIRLNDVNYIFFVSVNYKITSITRVLDYISSDVTGLENVVDNPDYIHGNDITGSNAFLFNQTYSDLLTKNPDAITDADIRTAIDTSVGLTCDDVRAEAIPNNPADDTTKGILQGILDSLTGTIASKIAAINDAITGAVSRTIEDIRENTREEEIDSNNIFEFFISLLMILKHLVLIVLKFIVFVVVVKDIPAQSSLFNSNTKAVIDYIHNHSLPLFNVSFMQIINAFIGILVAVSVIRIINKNVRANL